MRAPSDFLQKIRVAFAVAAGAMLVFGLASYVAIDRLVSFGHEAVHAEARLVELERLAAAVGDSDTAVRNYVLAGRRADRDRLDSRVDELYEGLAALRRHRLPEQQQLEALTGELVAAQRRAVALRDQDDPRAALLVLRARDRAQPAQELASLLSRVRVDAERQWVAARETPTGRWAQWLALAAAGLLFALFAWVLFVSRNFQRERAQAQARLDYSEAMSRTLAANMAEGLVTTSADLTVVDVNAAALQLLGYAREDLIGRTLSSLLAADVEGVELVSYLGDALRRDEPFRIPHLQALGLQQTGRLVPLRIALNDLHVGGQRMVAVLIHDMTGIQRATEALHASESQLRQITDALPVAVIEFDPDLHVRFHNRAVDLFLGSTQERIQGAHIIDALGETRFEAFRPRIEQALAGHAAQFEWTEPGHDGSPRHYQLHFMPRRNHRGQVIGCLAHGTDVTPLKRIDRMKTEFVSIVSHELRTPLTSIRGSLGLISGGAAGKLPQPITELVGIAKTNCDRLVRLINDILDIEKIESGKLAMRLQQLDVVGVVRQAMAANEGFARQHEVQLQLEATEDPAIAEIDSDRLIQVTTNLLSNAVKFSPLEGTVSVRVLHQGDAIRVEVQDQGTGIPLEFQDRIFQKFSQADSSDTRRRGGTGLGLAISRSLIEGMGGRIGFSSPPGAGATFFFELPATQPVAVEAPAVPHSRVLVCESDPATAQAVAQMLSTAGFATGVAQSAPEALEILEREPYDVVTLDPALSGAEDAEFLESLRRVPHGRSLPVVVIAERSGVERLRGRVSLAVALWLDRPVDQRRLVDSLREAIGGASSSAPQILHVEDDPDIQRIVATIARDTANCVSVAGLNAARAQLRERRFDLVLLDLKLTDGCGWELLADLDRLPERPPVIVFSASDGDDAPAGGKVDAMLVKSHTSEAALLEAIQRALPGAATGPETASPPELEPTPT